MEILIYGHIDDYSASDFHKSIVDNNSDSLIVRINSNGGNVTSGWSMIAKFSEFEGKKLVKVDGSAYSMAAMFTVYADQVEALDVSEFMFHRAAYPSYVERYWFDPNSDEFDEARKNNLIETNKSLEKAFRAKVDVEKFEEISGVSVKSLFAMDWNADKREFSRVDVYLTAKQAKQIGLVSKINKITPERANAISTAMVQAAARFEGKPTKKDNNTDSDKDASNSTIITKTNKMTKEDFKSKFPEAYNALVSEIKEAAITAERERVDAWMTFHDVDPEAVQAGISEGKDLGMKATAEFTKKMAMKGIAEKAGEASPEPTPEAAKTESEKTAEEKAPEMSDFEKQVNAGLGIEEEKV